MRTSIAYFAGAGTVVIAIAAGLGGGMLIADTMNPKTPSLQATKLERRTASTPSPAPSPSPSPLLAATQPAATPVVKDAPAQPGQDGAKAQSAATAATNAPAAKPEAGESSAPPSPSSSPAQREAHDRSGAPDAAFAKARDPDLKTADADTKHSAERRQTRRHQQWVERRGMQRQSEPSPRDVEQAWRDDGGARNYRDDSGARSYRDDSSARAYRDDRGARGYADDSNARAYPDGYMRGDVAQPVEMELPRVRLFDGF
jgi:hypothetical protein